VLAILFGLIALLRPGVTVLTLALLFAAYAVMDGAGMIAGGLDEKAAGGRRWFHLAAGMAGVVAGLIAASWPQITVLALVLLAGAWAVATGALEIAAAVRLRREPTGQWLLAAVGGVSMLAGIVILLRPAVGVLALATMLGVYALIAGVALLAAARRVRQGQVVVMELESRSRRRSR
jgi:uncharacterized membrane protein HdeD (DUF308 family)